MTKELVKEKVTKQDGSRENSLPPLRGGVGGSLTMGKYEPRPCGCSTRKLVHNHFPACTKVNSTGWGLRGGTPQSLINVKGLFTYLPIRLFALKHAAFTLAEILITLAVIGIVAAMTIPSLVQSYKKREYSAKLKKYYSMMQQVIKLSEIDNGSIEYWSKSPEVFNEENKYDKFANADLSEQFFTQYLAPYIKYTSAKKAKSATDSELVVYLIDGTQLLIHNGGAMDISIDVNGDKKPNSYGYDIFTFTLGFSTANTKTFCGGDGTKHFCPIGVNTYKTREAALNACKKSGYYCTSLLFYDNWEFKDDYPYNP